MANMWNLACDIAVMAHRRQFQLTLSYSVLPSMALAMRFTLVSLTTLARSGGVLSWSWSLFLFDNPDSENSQKIGFFTFPAYVFFFSVFTQKWSTNRHFFLCIFPVPFKCIFPFPSLIYTKNVKKLGTFVYFFPFLSHFYTKIVKSLGSF